MKLECIDVMITIVNTTLDARAQYSSLDMEEDQKIVDQWVAHVSSWLHRNTMSFTGTDQSKAERVLKYMATALEDISERPCTYTSLFIIHDAAYDFSCTSTLRLSPPFRASVVSCVCGETLDERDRVNTTYRCWRCGHVTDDT